MGFTNLEGRGDFDVDWAWERGDLETGMTAVLRVKNEARSMPWVLPPLLHACRQVVVVDNQSDDGTAEMARRTAAERGLTERLTVTEYPFAVSRCGPEHLATPERSLHNLAYFYNWSFAHVRTTYSMKWDGDMVLTREGAATFADLSWQLGNTETVVTMPRHPLFVESDRVAYLDVGLRNIEPWIYPMGPDYTFVKAFEWELRLFPDHVERLTLPGGLCVELKYLDSDEFSHWTDPDAFATSVRTLRKRREWTVFNALAGGEPADSLESVVRIESPPGIHVIDHVTNTWLPQADRPIVKEPVNA
ncbi:hypothetical protein [Solicola gregarius]|uniref:Uncharacterized protein n=1 Tax=Solicola gregarius TaxID=2908642 RepID=A0AA46YKM2_9ACTN|nr:hypothetical protein [Solicola gregarius]UYM04631.1 hypothetical protein L0C25_19165 [Solicola gregarius]